MMKGQAVGLIYPWLYLSQLNFQAQNDGASTHVSMNQDEHYSLKITIGLV